MDWAGPTRTVTPMGTSRMFSPAACHGTVCKGHKEDLETMGLQSEWLFLEWLDACLPKLDSIRHGIVYGTLVEQCWCEHKDKVLWILGCHDLSGPGGPGGPRGGLGSGGPCWGQEPVVLAVQVGLVFSASQPLLA